MAKESMPSIIAFLRTPVYKNGDQRWMTSIIVQRSFRQFHLHDETVLCRIHIAFQHAERDFHELRIALADLDVAGFELVTIADEDDSAILDGLQRRRFHRYSHLFRR